MSLEITLNNASDVLKVFAGYRHMPPIDPKTYTVTDIGIPCRWLANTTEEEVM
jgi:hypothetical protein